jgi:hypothetical protein
VERVNKAHIGDDTDLSHEDPVPVQVLIIGPLKVSFVHPRGHEVTRPLPIRDAVVRDAEAVPPDFRGGLT